MPGIAGIVLTVGMSVDANVLIFERIREELGNGNTPQASIRAGWDKAYTTILDSNLTTLIAAIVLFMFGTGRSRALPSRCRSVSRPRCSRPSPSRARSSTSCTAAQGLKTLSIGGQPARERAEPRHWREPRAIRRLRRRRAPAAWKRGVHLGVAGDDVAAIEVAVAAVKVADPAAGLADHERAGRDVPLTSAQLEERVDAARGDVAQVERRGDWTAHAGRFEHDGPAAC